MDKIIRKIKTRLDHSLPGRSSQLRMAPEIRRIPKGEGPEKHAAVLLLIIPFENELSLILIKRSQYDGPHSGQISFPGGMKETTDSDYLETALRESNEETGLITEEVKILGSLTELQIPISNYVVKPFVGFLDYSPEFTIDPVEVDHIIIVPLNHLLNKDNIRHEMRRFGGESFSVPYYKYKEYKIWGATAMMLSEFLSIIEGLEPDHYFPED